MAIISSLEKERVSELVQEIYTSFEEQGKKVPEWVQVMAHRPEILKEFFELFRTIMAKGEIEGLLKWKIAFTVSETLKCPFCVDVTTKMLKKWGADDETIKQIQEKVDLPEQEQELLELVRDITLDGHLDKPELFLKMQKIFDESQIVEIVSIIGLFNYINRFNNTLGILPE